MDPLGRTGAAGYAAGHGWVGRPGLVWGNAAQLGGGTGLPPGTGRMLSLSRNRVATLGEGASYAAEKRRDRSEWESKSSTAVVRPTASS